MTWIEELKRRVGTFEGTDSNTAQGINVMWWDEDVLRRVVRIPLPIAREIVAMAERLEPSEAFVTLMDTYRDRLESCVLFQSSPGFSDADPLDVSDAGEMHADELVAKAAIVEHEAALRSRIADLEKQLREATHE